MSRDEREDETIYKVICNKLTLVALIVMLALPFATAGQSKKKDDPLKPYTACKVSGGLKVVEVARRKDKSNFRTVTTDKGEEKVSVVDGYRVMFSYPDLPYYYANVKIEQSDPQSYADDKERVINQLKRYASIKQATKMIFADKTMLNGFEHYGIDRDVIDVGGQVGTHLLLDDANHLIITLYFLNQQVGRSLLLPNNRRFNTIEEYIALRDDFLNRYSECLRGVAGTKP